jgi:hypothetical protein
MVYLREFEVYVLRGGKHFTPKSLNPCGKGKVDLSFEIFREGEIQVRKFFSDLE